MKRSRFSETQIIRILKEHEAGMSASDLRRKHAIGDATLYNWRREYDGPGGLGVAWIACLLVYTGSRLYRSGNRQARRRGCARTLEPLRAGAKCL